MNNYLDTRRQEIIIIYLLLLLKNNEIRDLQATISVS